MLRSPTVFVVDDDPLIRDALQMSLGSAGFAVACFGSAEEFLAEYSDASRAPRCLIADIRLSGLSGIGLLERLKAQGIAVPVIVMTGYSNIPLAVQAMTAGAFDFIEKPFSFQDLLTRVEKAMDYDAQQRVHLSAQTQVASQIATLSRREREVQELIVAGQTSKQIAAQLKISEKTVAKHRARLLEKMGVESTASLVRQVMLLS